MSQIPLILASGSPRRQQLLRDLGFDFEVVVREVDESFPQDLSPEETVIHIAEKKAEVYADLATDHLVITADTIVVNDASILNKPEDAAEALAMLKALSGKSHRVISAAVLSHGDRQVAFAEQTKVVFRDLSDELMLHYIEHYQPYDKAGAYGIQEWIGMVGITAIHGDYYTVMGLPTARLYEAILNFRE